MYKMSLITWLPLISDTKNKGLSYPVITTTGTIAYNNGKLGTALTFNNTAITLKPAPLNTNTKEFSFAFWFKPTSTNSYQCLYNGRTTVGGAIAIFRDPSNLWRFDDGTQRTFNFGTVVNEWHHYVFTRDESNVKLYIDGVLKQTMTASSFTCETASASIGMSSVSNATPNANPITGQVNDYRIYDHVLSVKEVKELAKGLCVYIPLDWGANPNLAINSQTLNGFSGKSNFTGTNSNYLDSNGVRICKALCSADSNGGPYCSVFSRTSTIPAVNGTTYTWSMYIRGNREMIKNVGHECGGTKAVTITPEWQYVTKTWTYNTSNYQAIVFYGNSSDRQWKTGDWIEIKELKIEEGSIATPYIPNTAETLYTEKQYFKKFAEDCSGYVRVISKGGTATIGEDSPRGTGTYCTSGCYVKCDTGFPINANMPTWSITFWFRPDIGKTFTSWSDVFRFWINTEAGNNTLFRLETQNSSGNNYCLYYNNSGASSYGGGALTTITENKWYHLAFCCDSTKIYQYVNSELKITHTINTGYKPTGPTGYFQIGDGGMYASYADVRVYATCLSADDIKELYQIPVQIDKTGKVYCNNLVEV